MGDVEITARHESNVLLMFRSSIGSHRLGEQDFPDPRVGVACGDVPVEVHDVAVERGSPYQHPAIGSEVEGYVLAVEGERPGGECAAGAGHFGGPVLDVHLDSIMARRLSATMAHRPCPICGQSMYDNPRYPRAICGACIGRATDVMGRRVQVGSYQLHGTGVVVHYLDGTLMARPEIGYDGPTVYVDGIACETRESYLGGVELLRADY